MFLAGVRQPADLASSNLAACAFESHLPHAGSMGSGVTGNTPGSGPGDDLVNPGSNPGSSARPARGSGSGRALTARPGGEATMPPGRAGHKDVPPRTAAAPLSYGGRPGSTPGGGSKRSCRNSGRRARLRAVLMRVRIPPSVRRPPWRNRQRSRPVSGRFPVRAREEARLIRDRSTAGHAALDGGMLVRFQLPERSMPA